MRVSPRRRSRELALQGMYQWQYTGATVSQVLKNLSELDGFAQADDAFLKAELAGAIAAAEELRERLEPRADRKWHEISPVEKGILLLGAWEMVHQPEIPYRVTINEAVELGKKFGGTDGHKYVNGVLDRLAASVRGDEVNAPPARAPRRGGTRRKAS